MSSDTTAPPVPTGGLTILWDIGAAARLTGMAMDAAIADSGLSAREFYLLSVLAAHGDLTPGDIALRAAVPAPTVSRVLARFRRDGLVEDRPNPDDRRSRLVALTDDGREAIRAAQPGLGGMLDALYDRLGLDMADVIWSLRRLEWAMRHIAGQPPLDSEEGSLREPSWIRWSGPTLTEQEEAEVLRYMEWMVHRRDPG